MSEVTEKYVAKAHKLNELAAARKQTLAQMALAWVLKDERMTSVIVGASSVEQLAGNLRTLDNLTFTGEELLTIASILDE